MGKSDGDRLLTIERCLRKLLRRQHDLVQRLEWFLDPPPKKPPPLPAAETPPPPSEPATPDDPVDFARLKKLRPNAWQAGRDAFDSEKERAANPHRDTRGGFRNAWFGGWEERKREKGAG